MSEKTAGAVRIAGWALVLGLLCDLLLRAAPWGINLPVSVLALLLVSALLIRPQWRQFSPELLFLAPAALFFAAGFAWRASPTLLALDGAALVLILAVAILRSRRGRLAVAAVSEYPLMVLRALGQASIGAGELLFQDVEWQQLSRPEWGSHLGAAARGLVLAVPFLIVFAALFASADPVFASMATGLLRIDLGPALAHLGITLAAAWGIAGLLHRMLAHAEEPEPASSPFPGVIGMVEIGVAVGLLNLLFLAFVLIQLGYLFGGDSLVQHTPNLTYADYARRGFFEMVAAAALALPVLLLAHWALAKDPPSSERIFLVLAAPLLLMLLVILVSAGQRMRLYQAAYGFTELRVYTSAFMLWLGIVIAWFGATVLRGRRDNFAPGAALAAFAVTAGLHLLNPDAWIVQRNLEHHTRTGRFDVEYAASLSADAYPTLAAALPGLPRTRAAALASELLDREYYVSSGDWRSWSWSRAQAQQSLLAAHTFHRTLPAPRTAATPAAQPPPAPKAAQPTPKPAPKRASTSQR
ncbi:MAG: DUF4153 domain-containing protein [Armatimonadota bacterium]